MLTSSSRNKLLLGVINRPVRFFVICLCACLIICCLIALAPLSPEGCQCANSHESLSAKPVVKGSGQRPNSFGKSFHKLAVLVPFRDRFEELLKFVPHMKNFLSRQNINFKIYILNQADNFRFNRASLINVGFLKSQQDSDYMAMHDVDLLPINQELSYRYPSKPGPYHVASPELHPRYHYATFVGGILLIKREEFLKVDGMSNKYWGWGLEDDEFYVRLKEAGLNVSRPLNISTGTENTFLHVHDRVRRKRDMTKCFNQKEVTRRRDRETGLHNVEFTIENEHEINIDGASAVILNIKLKCNRQLTPWCLCESEKPVLKLPSAEPVPVKMRKDSGKLDSVIVPNVKKTVKSINNNSNKKSR